MEVVRPHDEDDPGVDPAAPDDAAPDDSGVLQSLVALAAEGPLSDDLVPRALELLVSLLDLSGATLSRVREHDDVLQLEPIASAGAHAAFARDMSARPLESLADVATAVSEGRSVFVIDSHGPASAPATETGVGRWRSTISAHATGVLPVRAWGSTLGVLTIEWPGSRHLGERERRLLEAAAGLIGMVLSRLEEAKSPPDAEAAAPTGVSTAIMGVTAEGVVVPHSDDSAEGVSSALTVSVATRYGTDVDAPIWDIAGTVPGAVALSVGTAAAAHGGSGPLAATAVRVLGTYASQGVTPADALVYLGHAVRATAQPGARVSALACSVEMGGPVVTVTLAMAGAVMWMLLSADGRFSVGPPERPSLSAAGTSPPRNRHLLLLPGDRLVLFGGQVGPVDQARGRTAVRKVLEEGPESAVATGRTLLGMLEDQRHAGVVAVIEAKRPRSNA